MPDKPSDYRALPIELIHPDPNQPRKTFREEDLRSLAESIAAVGVLCPITVSPDAEGYRIVAGERRWRAARLCALTTIPALVRALSPTEQSLAALSENLQRKDLDPFEEAEGIRRFLRESGLTQAEAARALGKSQSGLANKLRLLALDPALIETLRRAGLSERHARALLSLPPEARPGVLERAIREELTVEQTERLVARTLSPRPRRRQTAYIKDLRFFTNTIEHSLGLLKRQGLSPKTEKREDDDAVYYSITIPKRRA